MKIDSSFRRTYRSAFTLMEMMLVLAIIALLIAVGAVTLPGILQSGEVTAVQAQIGAIETAMLAYKNNNRKYPSKLEDLVKPPQDAKFRKSYMDDQGITDPWGEKYQLRSPAKNQSGKPYEIYSMGPDKADGTDDDVYR